MKGKKDAKTFGPFPAGANAVRHWTCQIRMGAAYAGPTKVPNGE
jgi:hypothetical protein